MRLNQELKDILIGQGYCVYTALNAVQAQTIMSQRKIDCCLLDIVLPDKNGFDFCRETRKKFDFSIIMLTGRGSDDDIVEGLEAGADDYIVKPFSSKVLFSRIKAQLRKSRGLEELIQVNEFVLNKKEKTLFKNGADLKLSALEFDICRLLMENSGRIITREVLMGQCWEIKNKFTDDNAVNVQMYRLRLKIGAEAIETIKGIGYRWKAYEN